MKTAASMPLRLGADDGAPLYRRAEGAIRSAIEDGRLKPGDRVPSVVDLAARWKVHKLTVLKAFRRLEADGLLESHVGRGTFVRSAVPSPSPSALVPASSATRAAPPAPRTPRQREAYDRRLREWMASARRSGAIDLVGGVPSAEGIPDGLLGRLAQKALSKDPQRLYGYGGPAGLPELREAIARTLAREGTEVSPEDVIVTNGSQQAIALVAAWARDEGRAAFVETPSFTGIDGAFALFGHDVQSVPWADGAFDVAALRASAGGRRGVAYVCPDFHNPTGWTMPVDARRALAAWAREEDGAVVDDEIFRPMRFEGEAPQSLYSLLPAGRRFLAGSVSKSFMTGLRVGFLVADAPVVADLLTPRRHMDLGSPALVQAIAAAFLDDGYEEHVARMREANRARRDAALTALEEAMPKGVRWTRPEGGFQMWVTLPDGASSIDVFLEGVDRGVAIAPGPVSDTGSRWTSSFRLGYGHGTPQDVREGVRRLAGAVEAVLSRRGASSHAGIEV
jgi:GntR family transcriptional regulator/MocR family aminotransferase